jgi:hypothetical protein
MRMTAGEAAGSPIPHSGGSGHTRIIVSVESYAPPSLAECPSPGHSGRGRRSSRTPCHNRRPFLTRNSHCVAADRLSISCLRHSRQRKEIRAALVLRHVPPMLGDQNNHCNAVRDRSEQPTDCEAFVSLVQVAPLTISTTGVSLLEVRILSGGAISGAIAANPPPI